MPLFSRGTAEHHQGRRKRRRIPMPAEFQPAANETNRAAHRVVVPPRRVRSGRHQADDERAARRFFPRLAHPFADRASVRRIHPHPSRRPALGQPVGRAREIARAFVVFGRRAGIEFEWSELAVDGIEKGLRRRPLVARRGKVNGVTAISSRRNAFRLGGAAGRLCGRDTNGRKDGVHARPPRANPSRLPLAAPAPFACKARVFSFDYAAAGSAGGVSGFDAAVSSACRGKILQNASASAGSFKSR